MTASIILQTVKGASVDFPPNLRAATIDDIPAMSSIRLSVRENILSDPTRVTEQMYIDYLDALGRGWVAECDGKVMGFCYAASGDSSIWALFVSPEYEGLGLGKRLLACAVDWLFALGKQSVQLSTGANTRADKFYCAQGWLRHEVDGANEVRYELQRETAAAAPTTPAIAALPRANLLGTIADDRGADLG